MSKAVYKRRSLLKQLGAAAFLGTPVFRSVFAEAQGQAPLRFVVFHFPSGVSMVDRSADATIRGSTWSFDHYLAPLKDIQSDVLLFERFPQPTAQLVSTYEELEGHGGGLRTMLTGNTNQRSDEVPGPGSIYGDATSVDQLLANAYGNRTKFGSLQLGVITRTNGTDWARRVIYNNGTFIEPVEDARATFARLFPDGGAPTAPAPTMTEEPALTAELIAEHAAGKSRLDLLKAQINSIKAVAGSDEQAKLDLHLTALRELEQQLPSVGGPGGPVFQGVTCGAPNIGNPAEPKVSAPEGTNVDYMQELGPVMQELMYQAINCDLTRIASFQWMSSGDNNIYPFLGVNTTHHGLEHSWQDSVNAKTAYDKIQAWLMLNISNFILRLKATPEGDGSMLDNTAVFVASEMWGGHSHHEYIALVAGKAGGKIRGGRTLDGNGRSHNDILAGLVNVFGLNVPVVGDPKYCAGPVELG